MGLKEKAQWRKYLFWGLRKEISREEVVRKISNANPVSNDDWYLDSYANKSCLVGYLVWSGLGHSRREEQVGKGSITSFFMLSQTLFFTSFSYHSINHPIGFWVMHNFQFFLQFPVQFITERINPWPLLNFAQI